MIRLKARTLPIGLLVALALSLTATHVAHAQEYRGRVQGVVSDVSQAVVVDAKVTLTNVKTGVSTARTTDHTGHYLFDLVEPGSYRVTVEL